MIEIEITNPVTKRAQLFKVKTKWDELTIQDYKKYHYVHEKHKEEISKEDVSEVTLMLYYKELTAVILNKPVSFINQVHQEDVTALLNGVNELLLEYPYKEIQKFTFEDIEYWFPQKFMEESTFGEYIETTQLETNAKIMKNGKFDVVAEQMARCCKTEEEFMNNVILEEDVVKERAEKFNKLSMDIVWEFCFFLQQPFGISIKDSPIYGVVQQEVERALGRDKFSKVTDG